jgi:hypothetical protein
MGSITKFPDGSVSSVQRLEAATVRLLDAYMTMERSADRLLDELEQMTSPGVVRVQIDEDDSLVIAIQDITHRE